MPINKLATRIAKVCYERLLLAKSADLIIPFWWSLVAKYIW